MLLLVCCNREEKFALGAPWLLIFKARIMPVHSFGDQATPLSSDATGLIPPNGNYRIIFYRLREFLWPEMHQCKTPWFQYQPTLMDTKVWKCRGFIGY